MTKAVTNGSVGAAKKVIPGVFQQILPMRICFCSLEIPATKRG